MHGLHLGSGELCSMSWRAECLHKLLGILLDRKIGYFPPYVSLFSMIYTVYTHGYSVRSVGSHMIVLHFVAQTVPAWAIRKLSLLAPMSLFVILPSWRVFPFSLLLGATSKLVQVQLVYFLPQS